MTVAAGQEKAVTVNMTNINRGFGGDFSGIYFQGTLTVTGTLDSATGLTFGQTDGTNPGTGTIRVFVWDDEYPPATDYLAAGANTTPDFSGVITTNGGKAVIDIPLPGTTKLTVLAMYDYIDNNATAGIADATEYYTIYNNSATPGSSATNVSVHYSGTDQDQSISMTIGSIGSTYQFTWDGSKVFWE